MNTYKIILLSLLIVLPLQSGSRKTQQDQIQITVAGAAQLQHALPESIHATVQHKIVLPLGPRIIIRYAALAGVIVSSITYCTNPLISRWQGPAICSAALLLGEQMVDSAAVIQKSKQFINQIRSFWKVHYRSLITDQRMGNCRP